LNTPLTTFITPLNDPNTTEIPAGSWNFEIWALMSSGGGLPTLTTEIFKRDISGVETLIVSNIATPTPIDYVAPGLLPALYLYSLGVPQTSLLTTDRIVIKLSAKMASGGTKDITLFFNDNTIGQVTTSFRIPGAIGATGPTGPVAGLDKQIIFNAAGDASGSPNLLWDYTTNELIVDGKLTVTGLIDPTGLVLTPVSTDPSAGAATIWVDVSNGNRLTYRSGGLDVSGIVTATGVSSSGIVIAAGVSSSAGITTSSLVSTGLITTVGITSNGAITTNAAVNAATIGSTGLITTAGVNSSAGITATSLASTGGIRMGGITTTFPNPITTSNYAYFATGLTTANLPTSAGITGQQFLFVNSGAPPGSTITLQTTGGQIIYGAGTANAIRTVAGHTTAIVTSLGSLGWAMNIQ
jgi:hypothetical protein